jgi:hypothetical protein
MLVWLVDNEEGSAEMSNDVSGASCLGEEVFT